MRTDQSSRMSRSRCLDAGSSHLLPCLAALALAAATASAAAAQSAGSDPAPHESPGLLPGGDRAGVQRGGAAPPVVAEAPGSRFGPPDIDAGPLLRWSDLAYARVFFGSLLAVEPLEGLESEVGGWGDRDGRGLDAAFASVGDLAGNALVDFGAAGATFAVGALVGSDEVRRVGLRSAEALALTQGVVGLFKIGLGRSRPYLGGDPDAMSAFTLDRDRFSFPSGHTAQMFALAGTLDRLLGDDAPWVPWVAYPAAALTGASRVVGREHWVTDVVAGAAAGLFASEVVGRLHDEPGRGGWLSGLRPFAAPAGDGGGLLVGAGVRLR